MNRATMKSEDFENGDQPPAQATAAGAVYAFDIPRVIRKSQPLPSLMHLCSYASSHTEG
jgi:hypothetical protein